MLKGLTNTFKNNCNKTELTYREYIVINNQQIPVRAKLSDDSYVNGNFIGSFILKTIRFETSNDVDFKAKEFEYYKEVDGESIKIGTFITTEVEDNDTTEIVKVVGMDYGLKAQVEYVSQLNYESGNITLLDVWNEACELSGIESGVLTFENADFIVDSDQFTGTGAMIRDVFIGIALSSGSFIKVMNDDKIYLLFNENTSDLSNEYTQLDYIESTGTQWIDTELYPTENMQIETKIEVTTNNQDISVFGSSITSSGASLGGYFHLTPYNNKWYYGTNGSEGNFGTYSNVVGTQYDIIFNNENNQIIVNDNIANVTRPFSGATNSTLAISKRGSTSNNRFGMFKYFNFKIFDKSTNKYIRNFIPAKRNSDNAIGLYDLVENKFYNNSGTGTFTYGEEIDTTEIIEDYTELEDKRDTHPWTCLRLGVSNIDGENVDLIDQELVEEYGENWLIINDNPFAYNQSKREQLITAIFNKVKGFGYSSFVSKTSFKPYLTCGDKVKFRNRNGQLVDTILLRYTHEYKENDLQIQLEAPSEINATVKYVYPLSSIDIAKRTQIEVDKENVKISQITERTQRLQDDLNNNYYTIEQSNQMIQDSATGVTNTFSEAGGNNVFRNTGLWFENSGSDSAINPYEFWNGNVVKQSEEKAINFNAMLLQSGTLYQEQIVPNRYYTISFKYKRLLELGTAKCIINDIEYPLTEMTEKEFIQVIEVAHENIKIQFVSDTNNNCEIYDLMVNVGRVKLAYSQNQNETNTETVNISKGITITSTNMDTTFKSNADGTRIYNNNNMNEPVTKLTDKGIETNYLKVRDEAEIVDILIQRVGNHTWMTKI